MKKIIVNYLPYVVAIFIATNALFASFGPWLFAPEDVKTFVAMLGVFPLLLIWAIFSNNNGFYIKKTTIYLPISLFLIWCFVSLIYAVDTTSASYITYQYSTMIAVFFFVANTFKNTKQIKFFISVLLFVGSLITVLAALQFYLPNNTSVQNFVYQAVTPAGTFGNKNMLGHFLVILLPLAIVLALMSKKTWKIIIYTLAIVLIATMMFHIQTRAVWVSSFIVLLLLVFFIVRKKPNHNKNHKRKFIFISGFLLWFLLINTDANGFKLGFEKIEQRIQATVNTQNPRIPMWANTLVMIKDNIFTGVGIGGWEKEYPKYYDRVLKDSTFNESVRAERVHNEYLELLSGLGLIGFILFLWAGFLVLKMILKLLKNSKDDTFYLILGISLAIVGFSINAFFSFPVRVFFPAFLIMAFIGILVSIPKPCFAEARLRRSKASNVKETNWQFSNQFGYLLSIPIIMLGIIFAWQSYNTLLSKNYYYEAQAYDYHKDKYNQSMVFRQLLKSVYYNPYNSSALSMLGEKSIRLGSFDKGIDLINKALKTRPYHDASLLRLAMAYDVSRKKDKAIQVLHKILEFDEKNVKAHGQLARLYAQNKDTKNALKHKKLMYKWIEYFKNRSGFGPYDELADMVEKTIASIQNK